MSQDIQPAGGAAPHSILRDISSGPDGSGGHAGRRISAYAMVMIFVVASGGGAIGVMRHMGLRSGIDLAGTDIKYNARHAINAASFERVLHTLENSASPLQVPSEAIVIDPFRDDNGPTPASEDRSLAEAERARQRQLEEQRKQREQRQRDIESKIGSMRVVSIMGGSMPIANISLGGKRTFVKVGDLLDDLFTVVAIDGATVVVECDGVQYTLTTAELQQADVPPGGHRPGGR